MKKILFIITITLVFAISCSSKNKKKTDRDPIKLPKIEQVGIFKKLWSKKLEGGKESAGFKLIPLIDRNSVYVADQAGEVLKLDADSGKNIWTTKLDIELSAGPGVGSQVLVVGTTEGQAIALDKDSGSQLWTVKLSSEIISPPVIDNQIAIIRAQDGKVFALNTKNGKREWMFDTNIPNLTLRGNSKPIVKAGRVYIGFDNGKVAAIKQETGEVIWLQNVVDAKGKTELTRIVDIDGDMALIATDLYLSSAVGKTIAVATESGRVMWSKDIGSAAGVTASRSNLFVVDNKSNIHALNRENGTDEWQTKEYNYRQLTRPAYYLGDLVAGDFDGYIHVINGDDGSTLARSRMGKLDFYSAPVVSSSMLLAYNKDGTLTAFEYSR